MIATGLSLTADSVSAAEAVGKNSVAKAYSRLMHAEHQLLKSELAVEVTKSASFKNLLANGHASWLENRQQQLIVDILSAKLAAYERFETQSHAAMAGGKLKVESKLKSTGQDASEMSQTAMQQLQEELTALQQEKEKLTNVVLSLPGNDPWAEGYRLRNAVASDRVDVVAAKIELLEQLNASRIRTKAASDMVSTAKRASTFTAAWKRPSKDSTSMRLLIIQAELQIKLSQHHLTNETQRLASVQELVGLGMSSQRSVIELKSKVDAIQQLVAEQRDNLNWLKKDLDESPSADGYYTNVKAHKVSVESKTKDITKEKAIVASPDLFVLRSVLSCFELGQANYLRDEANLKGQMYREVLSNLEQAVIGSRAECTV